MQKLLIILITAFVLCVLLRISIGYFSANRLATGLIISEGKPPELSGCNDLHNCTASTASTKRNQIEPIAYNTEPAELISKVAKQIAKQRGTMIKTQNNHYLHATYKTWLLGYTDDLELLLDDASGILHIRSASRIGQSDLGANRKRIEALRTLLQGKI